MERIDSKIILDWTDSFDRNRLADAAEKIVIEIISEIHSKKFSFHVDNNLTKNEINMLYRWPLHVGVNTYLERLIRTIYNFDNGMTNFSLKFYKALLGGLVEEQDALKTSQIMCKTPKTNPSISSESKMSNVYYENPSNDFNTFDKLWTQNEINFIILLFQEISHLSDNTKNKNLYMSDLFIAYSDAIHSILLVKDQEVKKRIKKSTNRI